MNGLQDYFLFFTITSLKKLHIWKNNFGGFLRAQLLILMKHCLDEVFIFWYIGNYDNGNHKNEYGRLYWYGTAN